ncbi:hypothetical protein Ciccas_002794 [Cichlidogyrus casuarinus]|uniref:Ras-GAP domain-containing protein n=1 Tax=Cichlidogyrus casuarinus TaxID=1844966 RepID=A0ABD2QG77_9PLAT
MAEKKPNEWVQLLLLRFDSQLPIRTGLHTAQSAQNMEQNKQCLINVSKTKFSLVISGLTKILQNIDSMPVYGPDAERNFCDSQLLVLDTLEKCLNSPRDTSRLDEAILVKNLLQELIRARNLVINFINLTNENAKLNNQLLTLTSRVIFALSTQYFNAVFNRIFNNFSLISGQEDSSGITDPTNELKLIQFINLDIKKLSRLITEICNRFPSLKKSTWLHLAVYLERSIWNWLENQPQEFDALQKKPNDQLAECCERLFDLFNGVCIDSVRKKLLIWPLQMMLLVLCPKILEELNNAENGAPLSQQQQKKKQFLDDLKKALGSSHGHGSSGSKPLLTEAALLGAVNLFKAATYININDRNNILFVLVHSVYSDVQNLLFNPNKPYFRISQNLAETEALLTDFFVAYFRITPHNKNLLKVCLQTNVNSVYHAVLVASLYRIITQERLSWWPDVSAFYPKSSEIRVMMLETLNRINNHQPIRISHSLNLRDKMILKNRSDKAEDSLTNRCNLMLNMVRLVNANPLLLLYTPSNKQQTDSQNAAFDLMNGLVSLMQQSVMHELAQESMEALLCLHQPANIHWWNPTSPAQAFWEISSQLLYSIAQKLTGRNIPNYCEVLKWLREILVCRINFLHQHRDFCALLHHRFHHLSSSEETANLIMHQYCPSCGQIQAINGHSQSSTSFNHSNNYDQSSSNKSGVSHGLHQSYNQNSPFLSPLPVNPKRNQMALIKLETVFFVHLWSLDLDAVLTSMSCFGLLCHEAELWGGATYISMYFSNSFLPSPSKPACTCLPEKQPTCIALCCCGCPMCPTKSPQGKHYNFLNSNSSSGSASSTNTTSSSFSAVHNSNGCSCASPCLQCSQQQSPISVCGWNPADLRIADILPVYDTYIQIADHSRSIVTTGRAHLQKQILNLLRQVNHQTQGNKLAWEHTYMIWLRSTKYLINYPKSKVTNVSEDSCEPGTGSSQSGTGSSSAIYANQREVSSVASGSSVTSPSASHLGSCQGGSTCNRYAVKRRVSHQPPMTDHEVEDILNEWANMTGFLCALGAVALHQPQQQQNAPAEPVKNNVCQMKSSECCRFTHCKNATEQISHQQQEQEHKLSFCPACKDIPSQISNSKNCDCLDSSKCCNFASMDMAAQNPCFSYFCYPPGGSLVGICPCHSLESSSHTVKSKNGTAAEQTCEFPCCCERACPSAPLKVSPPSRKYSVNYISESAALNRDNQYSPVGQFVGNLLILLTCQHEKFGHHIQKHVKEAIGHELNPLIYPILFDQLRSHVDSCFSGQGQQQVVVTETHTLFIENVIFIMRNILAKGTKNPDSSNKPNESLGMVSIESLMLNIVRYVRHLDCVHSLQLKIKVCQLVQKMMLRREDLNFRQEMRFRSKLVDYLCDWVMGSSYHLNLAGANICPNTVSLPLNNLTSIPPHSNSANQSGDQMLNSEQSHAHGFTLISAADSSTGFQIKNVPSGHASDLDNDTILQPQLSKESSSQLSLQTQFSNLSSHFNTEGSGLLSAHGCFSDRASHMTGFISDGFLSNSESQLAGSVRPHFPNSGAIIGTSSGLTTPNYKVLINMNTLNNYGALSQTHLSSNSSSTGSSRMLHHSNSSFGNFHNFAHNNGVQILSQPGSNSVGGVGAILTNNTFSSAGIYPPEQLSFCHYSNMLPDTGASFGPHQLSANTLSSLTPSSAQVGLYSALGARITGTGSASGAQNQQTRDLDLACMEAVAALLQSLPLQPEETDRGDLMDAKSHLFAKYFTLFMNLLNDVADDRDVKPEVRKNNTALRDVTVQAMSNLLNANIDSGLMHAIGLGYHRDPQTRAAFMEVLTKILKQGTEFETLAESALAERYERLLGLVTMAGDNEELPIAMALVNVVPFEQMDELARVLVTLFSSKNMLNQFFKNAFSREIDIGENMHTLLRGNSISTKIMTFCFKQFGQNYLQSVLSPALMELVRRDAGGTVKEPSE